MTFIAEVAHKIWLRWKRYQMRREYLRYRRRARANGHTALDFGLWRRSIGREARADRPPKSR